MGKLRHDRIIQIKYPPAMVKLYNIQTDTFKNLCDEMGKPHGVSGMNIFYFFCLWRRTKEATGYEWENFKACI